MAVTTNTRKLAALLGASGAGIGTDGLMQPAGIDADMASQAELDALETETDEMRTNQAIIAIRQAADHNDVKYSLQDRIIDNYYDASGIDATPSTNHVLASGVYAGSVAVSGISTITGGGGTAASGTTGGAGGTGSGGASHGTGGAGSSGVGSGTISRGGNGSGTITGAGGGSGGQGSAATLSAEQPIGGNGSAAHYTGGGAGGGTDWDGVTGQAAAAGGTGYKAGGIGGTMDASAGDGLGEGGVGTTYGGGQKGTDGSSRKNAGGGGGWPGGGGGGVGDQQNSNTGGGSGGGATGGVIITYTDSSNVAQAIKKFNGTSYTVPSGATNLILWAIGGGGSGAGESGGASSSGGGGGGGGVSKSATLALAGGIVVNYVIGAGGARTTSTTGNNGVSTTATTADSDTPGSLTLQSTDTAAEAAPTKAHMVTLIEDSGGTPATINTDIKGYISRDSGSTFIEGTLVDEGDWGTNKRILAFHDLSFTGASGTAMCYKITTHNQSTSKETKIHATSIGWK